MKVVEKQRSLYEALSGQMHESRRQKSILKRAL